MQPKNGNKFMLNNLLSTKLLIYFLAGFYSFLQLVACTALEIHNKIIAVQIMSIKVIEAAIKYKVCNSNLKVKLRVHSVHVDGVCDCSSSYDRNYAG